MATIADIPTMAAPPRPARKLEVSIWPAVIVFIAILLPGEVRFELAGLQFYAGRIGLLIVFPWVVAKVIQGAIRLVLPDFLVMIAAVWMYIAMAYNYGFDRGLESGGIQAFELIASYLLARISLRTPEAAERLLLLMIPVVVLCGAALMVESLSHKLIVRPFFASIFGKLPTFEGSSGTDLGYDYRIGLLRAYGPFPHPILAGLFMSSLISMYALAKLKAGPRIMGAIAGFAAFFSLSSAAYIGMLSHLILLTYDVIQRHVRGVTWRSLLIAIGVVLTLVQLFSNGGVLSVIIRFTAFDQFTGYYRLLIWEYGGATALAHPWFGIGYAGYDRPVWMYSPSVDAHWLLMALRFGLIVPIAIGLALIMALIALAQSARGKSMDGAFHRGLAISLAMIGIQMFSVSLWGSLLLWFNVLLGMAVSIAQTQLARYRFSIRW